MTQEELKSLLHYDPDTGIFVWTVKRGRHPSGREARCVNKAGYIVIRINQKLYLAHRLAWLYMHGDLPKEIDHINGIKSDNRISNLRPANRYQQMQNTKMRSHNKTGATGVTHCKQTGKYAAEVRVDGKRIWLGRFDCLELAGLVASEHREKLHGKFART